MEPFLQSSWTREYSFPRKSNSLVPRVLPQPGVCCVGDSTYKCTGFHRSELTIRMYVGLTKIALAEGKGEHSHKLTSLFFSLLFFSSLWSPGLWPTAQEALPNACDSTSTDHGIRYTWGEIIRNWKEDPLANQHREDLLEKAKQVRSSGWLRRLSQCRCVCQGSWPGTLKANSGSRHQKKIYRKDTEWLPA